MHVRPFVGTMVVLALAAGSVAGASSAFAAPAREHTIPARLEQLHQMRPTAAVLQRFDTSPADPSPATTAAPAVQAPASVPSVAEQAPAVAQAPAVLLSPEAIQYILGVQQRLADFYAAVQRAMVRDYLRSVFVWFGVQRWGAQMACIRNRESHGNYGVMSRGGVYRGASQYAQSTWNNAAGAAGRGDLVGINPATVAPIDQDQVTIAYMDRVGLGPWGGRCG